MTSAAITELTQTAMQMTQNAKSSLADNMPNFSDFMAKETDTNLPASTQQSKAEQTDVKSAYEKVEKKAAEKIATDQTKQTTDTKTEDIDAKEQLDETSSKLKEMLQNELGISEEELEEAMEVLGLTLADLMNQGNMTQLVAKVNEAQPVDILTNDALFQQVNQLVAEVTELFEQVADDLGIDVSTVSEWMNQFEKAVEDSSVNAQTPVEMVAQAADTEVVAKEESLDEPKLKVEEAQPQVMQNEADVKTETVKQDANQQQSKQERRDSKASGMESAQQQHLQQASTENQVQLQDVEVAPEMEDASIPRTQEIIDQIAEYVKVHRSEQITEMEISLNPASLGNIHLQVATKAGVISAQLVAQDEAVAAALESQIVQLKESLEAQGMRVDAVEVTVASHEFEENLDQQGKQQEEAAKNSAAKKGQRRILDLNEMDAVDGADGQEQDLSQAEKLQLEMMRMGGNRMNYQV